MKGERRERQMKRHRKINERRGEERAGETTCAAGPVHFTGQVGKALSPLCEPLQRDES
jgi:hypothetical protein